MLNANTRAVIRANHSCETFLAYLLDNHSFNDKEVQSIKDLQKHLENLSVIFSKIKK